MKKINKLTILFLSLVVTTATAIGVTFATSIVHVPDSKSYTIADLDQKNANFQDLAAYFDKKTGEARLLKRALHLALLYRTAQPFALLKNKPVREH